MTTPGDTSTATKPEILKLANGGNARVNRQTHAAVWGLAAGWPGQRSAPVARVRMVASPRRRWPAQRSRSWSDSGDLVDVAQGVLGGLEIVRLDAVHESASDGADGADEQGRDEHGDEQADDGVCLGEAEQGHDAADDDGQGGEAVGAGVDAVGDQGRGADALADPDPVDGDGFVAEEPTTPAAITQPRFSSGRGWISLSMACQAASAAERATTNRMNRPARSSARW